MRVAQHVGRSDLLARRDPEAEGELVRLDRAIEATGERRVVFATDILPRGLQHRRFTIGLEPRVGQEAGGMTERRRIGRDELAGAFPTHRPVAIGFAEARHRGGAWTFDIDALVVAGDTVEADLIRAADGRMARVDTVTSFNGVQFDALVLRLAAQRCRLWGLKALADHAAAHRYGGEHVDLADRYSSFGRKVGLAAICEQLGIPVKTDVAGGDVAALWDAGQTERIRLYVMEDAVATLCLYLAWNASRAGDEALVTRPMAALARHIEATPDLQHLHAFVDGALMRWCRPRALRADVAAALERITARLRQQEEASAFATA